MAKFPMLSDDLPNPFLELEETVQQEEKKRLRKDLDGALSHIKALKKEVEAIKEAMQRQNAALATMISQVGKLSRATSSSSEG